MNTLSSDLVDEIIQNCEILEIIKLSHINIFLNNEIKKIFDNKQTKTNKEYKGFNVLDPLEFIYIQNNFLEIKKIEEFCIIYDKLLIKERLDLFTFYRLYNNFLKLFKEVHILTTNKKIIKNYYLLIKTLIIINKRSSHIFEEEGYYIKKKHIIMSLLRIILLVNPLNRHNECQEDMKIMFYNFIEQIIKNISKKEITEEIFFIKFLKEYLFELDNNCVIMSYIELFDFKKFIKNKIKENKYDIYNLSP